MIIWEFEDAFYLFMRLFNTCCMFWNVNLLLAQIFISFNFFNFSYEEKKNTLLVLCTIKHETFSTLSIWTGQLFSCSVTTVLIMNWQTITFMKLMLISWNVEETWGNHTISWSHINIHYRYWDPYYYRRRRIQKEDDGMNFIESVC